MAIEITKKPDVEKAPPTRFAHLSETYSPEQIAEFLLNNAVNAEDYASALAEVRNLGIDPATIPHNPLLGA